MKEGLDLRTVAENVQSQLASKLDYMPRARDLDFTVLERELKGSLAVQHAGIAAGGEPILRDLGHGHIVNAQWYDQMTGASGNGQAAATPGLTALTIPTQTGAVTLPLNKLANQQLASFLKIPSEFYGRLQAYFPELLATNVNTLIHSQEAKCYRTVRTLNGEVRAFLSDSYEPRDNWDLLRFLIPLFYPKDRDKWQTRLDGNTVMPGIRGPHGEPLKVEFPSCQVTDEALYIKIVVPEMTVQLREMVGKVGATLRWGAIIKNNEVGLGSNAVYPFWEILECTNGAYSTRYGTSKRHVGRPKGGMLNTGDEGSDNRHRSDATKYVRDKAYFLEMVDAVRYTLSHDQMERITGPMIESMGIEVTGSKEAAVEQVGRMMDLTDGEQDEITELFINNKDYSIYGLSQAITQYSGQVDSYDRATELEGIGGDIITLEPGDWRVIAEAKKTRKKGSANFSKN